MDGGRSGGDGGVERGGGCGPACRVRRRCRSEGLERSPYDYYQHAHMYTAEAMSHRGFQNFIANGHLFGSPERSNSVNITSFPQIAGLEVPGVKLERAEHGMHVHKHQKTSPTRTKSPLKAQKDSRPIRQASPLLRHDDRLPKVEELFEKLEHDRPDLMDFGTEAKQPLKSILNNPRTSPPPGILKKKRGQEKSGERRRQRAMSESEYNYMNFDVSRVSQESRLQNALAYMKRIKDNSGSALTNTPTQLQHVSPRDWIMDWEGRVQEGNVLRTTAIRKDAAVSPTPPPAAAPSPASPSPISSPSVVATSKASLKKRTKKVKVKSKKMRTKKTESGDLEIDDSLSQPPSPPCVMDTDTCASPTRDSDLTLRLLSDKLTNGAVVTAASEKLEATTGIPYELSNCVRPSLFPRVPPYFRFISHDHVPPLRPPLAIGKHLKWKLTSITPIVVKKTLINSGFKLVRSDCDTSECPQDETVEWIGIWGKHMKSLMFRAMKEGQKMNHFPGTFQIGRKDRLWRNLQKLVSLHGKKEFGIMPKTYVLPHDMKLLKRDWEKYATRNEKWIIKPPASARGTGIAVVSRWVEIPKKRSVIVQRYVAKPYLINGSKFDLRLYVLVTSMHPIKIYLFSEGLARFASVKYTEDQATLHDRYMHLTNYSINRLNKNYTSNEDASACQGHKWTIGSLMVYLERERGVDTKELWERLKDLVVKTILSGEGSIKSLTESNVTSRYNCYELFGIDVLLDEDLKPWLLEVNISPSLHSSSPLDLHVKGPLVTSVLNQAQYHLPNRTGEGSNTNTRIAAKYAHVMYDPRLYTVYLSKEERDKHIIYSKMEDRSEYLNDILSTLTPDDVRHLIQAEDELASGVHMGGSPYPACPGATPSGAYMERIFPTAETHKYLEFLPPRYYNRLLDAWECKYRHDRMPGINLLRSLCDIGYHLEVPPVPIKNESSTNFAESPEQLSAPRSELNCSVEVVATASGGSVRGCAGHARAEVRA